LARGIVEGIGRGSAASWEELGTRLLELVSLGSVADRVPLRGENRTAVALGLSVFGKTGRVGIEALRKRLLAGSERDLGPMELVRRSIPLIASGRSANGTNEACELLLSRDLSAARDIIAVLQKRSRDWQTGARIAFERILGKVDREGDDPVIIIVDEETDFYHIGYCASRLRELFGRPAFVIGVRGSGLVGEARGKEGFDLVGCLSQAEEYLEDYGGHKKAAGFSLGRGQLASLVARVRACAEEHPGLAKSRGKLEIDAEVYDGDMSAQLAEILALLRPFGEGNREPILLARQVELGRQGSRCFLETGAGRIMFIDESRGSDWLDLTGKPLQLDIVFTLGDDDQLKLIDSRPSLFNR
jgi:single-stranded-DNA-specific exonuclease